LAGFDRKLRAVKKNREIIEQNWGERKRVSPCTDWDAGLREKFLIQGARVWRELAKAEAFEGSGRGGKRRKGSPIWRKISTQTQRT